jgi:hypothetical protein
MLLLVCADEPTEPRDLLLAVCGKDVAVFNISTAAMARHKDSGMNRPMIYC